jgi:catechol 2,3-dioxygenase-like lactoylglutathione lyase family enzyme
MPRIGTSRFPDGRRDRMLASMDERLITHLRHVDLAVPDYEKQLEFYTSTWGLSAETTDSGIAFLAAEGSPEQYSVRLRRADEKRLDLISFGAATPEDVDEMAQRLRRDGVQLVTEPDKLDTPGGGYGFRFFDLDGRTLEVSADVAVRQHRRIEEGESIPVKLSHVVVNSPNPEATVAFYEKHLAFALSDTLFSPHMGDVMWFMRTNRFHHSLAIARGPHVALHHASFEMRGIDEYMRGTGRLLRAGVEKIWGPGRHMAGNNTFSYFLDPHGNTIEYTTELEELDEDTWHPHLYDFSDPEVTDQWGTANPMNEFVAKQSFNDPDRGVFVAPPV